MAILELRGLKVLPPPDLDDGESLWIGPGAVQPRQCSRAGSGVGRGHGRRRQAALPLVTGSSGKIPNSVS